ncbi:sirohydrochlorin chelatase [Antrihabitans sp. YC3-6]|uniref:Sirohydrochlorin chelatase n=1 Tax=Antrihabitans stalagmiti TaxID=2799499 RepID=A0A934NVZ9_9NOCA|nr:sirohydrochlorin chelatase [Antrihabitans stalagmiti]MBJ8342297.1 sirohydrochlorin chelatase [Antrihabitans stalagmiti]
MSDATVPLIAVAHGSRDPRSAATMSAVVAQLRTTRPDLDARLCFLDLNAPSVDRSIDAVAADGHTGAVVVPLLLGSAFHARVDLPALVAAAHSRHPQLRLAQADVLGADPRLVSALRARVLDTGLTEDDDKLGVVVAAVGSSSAAANRRTEALARDLVTGTRWAAETGFATSSDDRSVAAAAHRLRTRGARHIVVAPWFLAHGLLTDRVESALRGTPMTEPIGSHSKLIEVVVDRYEHAAARLNRKFSLSA